ncbi:MAG: glycosyltransferase family 2 protein [Coriobacteriaceae bacterium]|nr:glycosyltransferase family 2 protein [Coriobacteriaceae bacterium]
MDVSIIMPVYNEAETVEPVLRAVREVYYGEIIVIDDGSTDDTAMVLSERDDILLIRHQENLGYGKSLIDGFQYARFIGIEHALTMDVDGQHEPQHIHEFLLAAVEGRADIVSGSRYLPESVAVGEVPPERREVNERVAAEIDRVTGWGLTDAFCGFKAYRLAALDGLTLTEPGYAFPMQLWAAAHKAGLKVMEMPVERIYFDHDRSFGEDLDDAEKRFAYYMRVWREALGEEAPA